jgi:hypothetical protein
VQVPGTPSYGQGGWGISPRHPSDNMWLFSYIGLAAGTALSLTAVGKIGKVGWGLRSQGYRLLRPAEILGGIAVKVGGVYQKQQRWKTAAYIIGMLTRDYSYTPSPGGGGPGPSPISTIPPLSVEATGAILEQLGKPGGPASSSKRRSRPRRRKCPKGWHWSKQYNTCVRTAGFWKG